MLIFAQGMRPGEPMSLSIAHALRASLVTTVFATFVVTAHAQAVLSGVTQMSAGYGHTCAVLDGGGIDCWGDNSDGQLGDGTGVGHSLPVSVSIAGTASGVATGSFHSCAIVDGGMQCWGSNQYGALGDGTTTQRNTPLPAIGLDSGVTKVTAGIAHTCAIVNGAALCWGMDDDGEVGNGTEAPSIPIPTQVTGLTAGVTDVAGGANFSCALVDGAAVCWGSNFRGQLGNGTNDDSPVPVPVQGLDSGVTRIVAGGATACAIVNSGVKCWGSMMLGNGMTGSSNTPVDVTGLQASVIALAMSIDSRCATTSDLVVHCWGDNSIGEFGSGGYDSSDLPVAIPLTGFDVGTLTMGTSHSCAIDQGVASCWGGNEYAQLGIGGSPVQTSVLPGAIQNLEAPILEIKGGEETACALSNGALSCWGANNHGQLGDGTNLPRGTAAPVTGLAADVTDVAVFDQHTCAVANGGAYCWGDNDVGELGDGTFDTRWTPVLVHGLDQGVTAVAVGSEHSCAIVGGGVKCWGAAISLGDGDGTRNESEPVDVIGISGATAIAATSDYTCAIVSGAAKCWGSDSSGALGSGGGATALEPVQVVGLTSGVTAISAGGATTCAIVNGGAMCWGYGAMGQLGNGTLGGGANVPVPVTGLDSGVLAISVAFSHVCAMTASGAKCWGDNAFGELGTGAAGDSSPIPVDVTVLPPDIASISAGDWATCAVVADGGVCWGLGNAGQLGTGGVPWLPSPHVVMAADELFADGFDG